MCCFMSCFRINDGGRKKCHLFSRCSWKKRELVVPRNQYTSVASFEEKGNLSEKEQWESLQESFDEDHNVHRELRQEMFPIEKLTIQCPFDINIDNQAKFLKACGAILESPVEIRKSSYKHSIISDACYKRINWDQQLDRDSHLSSKVPETLNYPDEKYRSSQNEEHEGKSGTIMPFEESKHSGNEKLLGSAALDLSPSVENKMQPCSHESPYPTPLKLVDGMQTPGTVYPQNPENIRTGKIRTEFVYPVQDLSQRSFEVNVLCKGRDNTQMMPPASLSMEASRWLKHENKSTMDARKQISESDHSLHVDRPDTVAKWKEEPSHFSPKHWDGKGIPNSTTKYKEDQKVSWHATPFEVRLKKALSDEEEYPQREDDGRLIQLEDQGRE